MYKVLIVDDEPAISEGLKNLIHWEEFGLEVEALAAGGAEALDIIGKTHIDIVITDIRMPVMNGIQLLEQIKQYHRHIKCIVLSGYDEFEYVKPAAMMGIENYFLKPVDTEQLSRTLLNTVNKIESEQFRQVREAQDRTILRNNLLLLWLTGNISPIELKEKAEIIDFKLDHDCYMAAIGRFERNQGAGDSAVGSAGLEATGLISGILGKNNDGVCFYLHTGEIVILLMKRGDAISLRAAEALLEECCRAVHQKTARQLYITAGTLETELQDVKKSYESARWILDCFIMLPGRNVFTAHDADQAASLPGLEIDLAVLRRLLESKDVQGLRQWVSLIGQRLSELHNPSRSSLQSAFSNIVIHLLAQAKAMNMDMDSFTMQQTRLFSTFFQADTSAEMLQAVQSILEAFLALAEIQPVYSNIYVKKAIDIIARDYHKQINLKVLANEMKISSAYLGQMFRRETGQTFTDYINTIRVEKARELLIHTTMKVNEIAECVGFTNSTYFFAVFMKSKGLTPIRYREMNA